MGIYKQTKLAVIIKLILNIQHTVSICLDFLAYMSANLAQTETIWIHFDHISFILNNTGDVKINTKFPVKRIINKKTAHTSHIINKNY